MTRVLIVDDDIPLRALIVDQLRHDGYDVDEASNGAEALERLRFAYPGAIVLDLMMPAMHGWDFIESYRNVTGGESIPIVVLSAAGAIPRSLYALGVRRFIPKPFAMDELLTALGEI
jgi:two-component system response regulator MprA